MFTIACCHCLIKMTAEIWSDTLRRRSHPGSVTDKSEPNAARPSQMAEDMAPAEDDSCCCRHKIKFLVAVTGIILVGGLIALISIAAAYFKPKFKNDCIVYSKATTCLLTDATVLRRYGTKTDYDVARAELITPTKDRNPGCKPMHFYMLSRHAIRFPDVEYIEDMTTKLPRLQAKIHDSNLCIEDLANLKRWHSELNPADENHVTPSGVKQAQEIARRYQKMFPSLLNSSYIASDYEFGITSKPRTKETAVAFASGLFRKDFENIPYIINDYLLHFNKNCSDILKREGYNDEKAEEVVKFKESELMLRTVDDVSIRLGFNITFAEMELILKACAFEYAINGYSPWCAAFHKNNIRILEYYNDLDDFYDDAYGHERNYKQACPVVQDMVQQMRKTIAGTPRKALLYFSHAGVMKKVYAHLGLFKDDAQIFKADRFCYNSNRKWRSSLICPFNSNIAIVLFDCGGKYFVEAYIQEKAVILDGCTSTLCPWEIFEKKFGASSANCNLKRICVP